MRPLISLPSVQNSKVELWSTRLKFNHGHGSSHDEFSVPLVARDMDGSNGGCASINFTSW